MRKPQLSKNIVMLATCAAACMLFAPGVSAKDYQIDLSVVTSPNRLQATSRGNCRREDHPGCLRVDKGQKADINFSLKAGKECDMAEKADWNLSKVYLGGKNSETKPKPGEWGNLDAQVQADFDVADAATGLLNHQNGSNKQHIRISNNNKADYSIWYTVVANCVDQDGSVIGTVELDPRIRNTGEDN